MDLPQILLVLCGDVETNPGPARPDPKKVMEERVNNHDDKIAALEKILKKRNKIIESISEEQAILQKAIVDSQTDLGKSMDENRILSDDLKDLKTQLGEMNYQQVNN
jgi:septal ring factor EnvC (AmiA/AmiB activator)